MKNEKKTLSEYEQELLQAEREAKEAEAKDADNRDRAPRKKKSHRRLLITFLLVMCAIPLALCIYLLMRVNSMDGRLDCIADALGVSRNDVTEYRYRTETTDASTADQSAYLTPEIATSADIVFLAENYSENELEKEQNENAPDDIDSAYVDSDDIGSDGEEAPADDAYSDNEGAPELVVAEKPTRLNGKKVYLTFDDGPSEHTAEILDILKKNNVKATFFVIHRDEPELEQLYSRIVDDGHTIGMHSYTHEYEKVYASESAFEKDVKDIHDFIKKVTGVDAKFYRFPGGSSNDVSDNVQTSDMIDYLNEKGIVYFDWNAASLDAEDETLTPAQLNENVMYYVESNPGDSVVLMHDFKNCEPTVAALQSLIDTLKSEGYEILPITDDTEPVQHVTN